MNPRLQLDVVDRIRLRLAPLRPNVGFSLGKHTAIAGIRQPVCLDGQPPIQVVTETVLSQAPGVRKVASVVERAGLYLVVDDGRQALRMFDVLLSRCTRQRLAAQLPLLAEIDTHGVAANFNPISHEAPFVKL